MNPSGVCYNFSIADRSRFEKIQDKKSYQLKEIGHEREISLGGRHVQIVALPGHTKGSIEYLYRKKGF